MFETCLIAGSRRMRAANADIVLCAPTGAVGRLFATVGMDRAISIRATFDEAIRLLDARRGLDVDPVRLS